jgi:hypothetical protein
MPHLLAMSGGKTIEEETKEGNDKIDKRRVRLGMACWAQTEKRSSTFLKKE